MHKSGDSRSHHSVTFEISNQASHVEPKHEERNSSRAPSLQTPSKEKIQKRPEKCTCCCCSIRYKNVCIGFGIFDAFIAACRIGLCVLLFYYFHPLRDTHGHTEKEHEKEMKKYQAYVKNHPEALENNNRSQEEYMFSQHREAHYANIGLASFETYILVIASVSIIYGSIRYSSSMCKFYMGLKLFLMVLNILHLVVILIVTSEIWNEYRNKDLILPILIQFEAVFHLVSIRFARQLKLLTAVEELEETMDDELLVTSASIVSTSSRKILKLLEKAQQRANESGTSVEHEHERHTVKVKNF